MMTRKDKIEHELLQALSPVDPAEFTTRVKSYLQRDDVGVLVSDDTPKVIEKLCRLLNFSIKNPKIGGLLNDKNILIYPAETGIGKSVSIKHYVAMLNQESSLIIVNTTEEAREYCAEINKIREIPKYARFFVSKNTGDDNQILPKNFTFVPRAQCLVLTHKMFIQLHTDSKHDPDLFKHYKPAGNPNVEQQRDLVVIDERLSFFTKSVLKFNELEGIANFLEKTLENSPKFKDNQEIRNHISSIQAILEVINEEHTDDKKRASFIDRLSIEPKLEERSLPIRIDFLGIKNTVAARLDEINEEVSLLKPSKIPQISNLKDIKNGVVKTLNALIDVTYPMKEEKGVTYSGGEEVYREFAIYNKDLYRVRSLYNKFGTAVLLDATAEVNSFYELASKSNSNIDIVAAPKIRKYENLTIFKAQGHRQSANAIYDNSPETATQNAIYYANIIEEILEEGDKLLVISFKHFIENYLKVHLDHENRMKLTNWGKHVGRNDWSDCTKVMIIGWFRLPEEEVIAKLFSISSMGTSDIRTMKHVNSAEVKKLQLSEIADNLVQGAMRCCARVIDTPDSDCKKASMYLFQDVLDGNGDVIELFESQFPNADIVDWTPKTKQSISSLSKPNQAKENAILDLLKLSESNASYLKSSFCKEFNIDSGTMNRWLKKGHFIDRLNEIGFRVEKLDGKSDQFVFKK